MRKALVMVEVDIDAARKILQGLEPNIQNQVLHRALRKTAEQARERLARKAQDSYTIKDAGFNKAMRIRRVKHLAKITAEGAPLPLERFRYSEGNVVKAQVVKQGRLKALISQKTGIKAFVNNISARNYKRSRDTKKGKAGSLIKHFAIVQREGKKRLGIEEKYSSSIPVMLGSEKRVYGPAAPYIASDLQTNLQYFVDKALGKG